MERTQQALLSASQRDDVAGVRRALASGADVNHGNAMGQTALHIACLWGNASACAALVEAGGDVNRRNSPMLGRQTPVHMVASRVTNPAGRLACATALVEAGADLGLKNDQGEVRLGEERKTKRHCF